jgi:hypothetical protein
VFLSRIGAEFTASKLIFQRFLHTTRKNEYAENPPQMKIELEFTEIDWVI